MAASSRHTSKGDPSPAALAFIQHFPQMEPCDQACNGSKCVHVRAHAYGCTDQKGGTVESLCPCCDAHMLWCRAHVGFGGRYIAAPDPAFSSQCPCVDCRWVCKVANYGVVDPDQPASDGEGGSGSDESDGDAPDDLLDEETADYPASRFLDLEADE